MTERIAASMRTKVPALAMKILVAGSSSGMNQGPMTSADPARSSTKSNMLIPLSGSGLQPGFRHVEVLLLMIVVHQEHLFSLLDRRAVFIGPAGDLEEVSLAV